MSGVDAKMVGLLERLLDVASHRQSLIAANIANVDTPGYYTRDLDFEKAMAVADRALEGRGPRLEGLRPGHLPGPGALDLASYEFEPSGLVRRNDLNNVSVDREMLALARTAGRYSAAVEILRKRFALLRYALTEGRSG
jgi:flagellar basal-body rod protein FlgB